MLQQIPRRNAISAPVQPPHSVYVQLLRPAFVQPLRDSNSVIQRGASATLRHYGAMEAIDSLTELLDDSDEALGRLSCDTGLPIAVYFPGGKSDLNRREAVALGVIMGRKFRPNPEGVTAARNYAKAKGVE